MGSLQDGLLRRPCAAAGVHPGAALPGDCEFPSGTNPGTLEGFRAPVGAHRIYKFRVYKFRVSGFRVYDFGVYRHLGFISYKSRVHKFRV